MKSQNIRSEFWYCRAVETVKFGFLARRWSKNASTSAGCHCHGYWFENIASRRTSDSRGLIVESCFKNRVRCCRAHPSLRYIRCNIVEIKSPERKSRWYIRRPSLGEVLPTAPDLQVQLVVAAAECCIKRNSARFSPGRIPVRYAITIMQAVLSSLARAGASV